MKNHINTVWMDAYPFRLPCIERMAMAHKWLSENPHDIAEFKKHFPDAMSECSLLSPNEALPLGAIGAAKCPHHEDCILPTQPTGCSAKSNPGLTGSPEKSSIRHEECNATH